MATVNSRHCRACRDKLFDRPEQAWSATFGPTGDRLKATTDEGSLMRFIYAIAISAAAVVLGSSVFAAAARADIV